MISLNKKLVADFLFASFLITLFNSPFLGQPNATLQPHTTSDSSVPALTVRGPIHIDGNADSDWSLLTGDGLSFTTREMIYGY